MKFTWLSNAPFAPSGYGQQTRINVDRLAGPGSGNEAGIICAPGLESGMMKISDNIFLFSRRLSPFGADVFLAHSTAFGAQVAFSLIDVWVLDVENMPHGFRWIPWYPVDHEPMPPMVRQKLNSSWKRIAMSQFGVKQTHLMGMDCLYVPHSIETNVMKPLDKLESRKALGEKMRALQQDQDLTPEAKREKMKEMRDSNQATMKTILTPEQFEKWQKMAQPMSARPGRGGPDAPAKPDAAK